MPASGPTLHLHVGLPKTASTHLQSSFFPALTGIRAIGMPTGALFDDPSDRDLGGRVLAAAARRSPEIWRAHGDAILEALLGPKDAFRDAPHAVLLSEEGLGRIGSRPSLLRDHLAGIAETARGWGFARVTALCVVRRQDRWLASHYAQVSDRNPRASQGDFERNARAYVDPFGLRYQVGMLLDYARLHEALVSALGEPNVLMLAHEQLVRDADAFEARLRDFLGVAAPADAAHAAGAGAKSANVRSKGENAWAIRPYGAGVPMRPYRLAARLGLPRRLPRPGRGRSITLTPELSRLLLAHYEDANRAAAARSGIDFGGYGYY